jgi:hypothetical protein
MGDGLKYSFDPRPNDFSLLSFFRFSLKLSVDVSTMVQKKGGRVYDCRLTSFSRRISARPAAQALIYDMATPAPEPMALSGGSAVDSRGSKMK